MFERLFHAWFIGCWTSPKLVCSPAPRVRPRVSPLKSIPVCKEVHLLSGLKSLEDVNESNLPVRWWPISQTFLTANAISCTKTHIITIQVTVLKSHKLNAEVFNTIKENFPTRFWVSRKVCHVFITNDETKATALQNKKYSGLVERNITIYSTILNIAELSEPTEDVRQEIEATIMVSNHMLLLIGIHLRNSTSEF